MHFFSFGLAALQSIINDLKKATVNRFFLCYKRKQMFLKKTSGWKHLL